MNNYENYIYKSRYARYLPEEERREEWPESVRRYIDHLKSVTPPKTRVPWSRLEQAILNREVMPSMRALMTAGPALQRDNVAGYNCAYVAVDNIRVFDEVMYILLCGTGVGYSVERQYINQLPEVAEEFHDVDTVIKVRDSKIGWASAYRQLVSLLYQGQVPRWDVTNVRPAGTPLRTFGGRASGPDPLVDLFVFTTEVFRRAVGRKLNSLEVHDVICKIAEVVICGGVRRSALLSLSNLTDERLRGAKDGEFYHNNPQRAMANNSVCYTERPDMGIFMREWQALYSSRSGERGIFYRGATQQYAPERRDATFEFGTNPCSEIVLRSKQFCNLTEAVIRPEDTVGAIKNKVELATILGTLQAQLTDFRYLSKVWQRNTEEERLLGVSLTGIMDHPILSKVHEYSYQGGLSPRTAWVPELRDHAVKVNEKFAKRLGINPAAAVTCVKPSGTVSQLCNTASGIHPRYAHYYLRRVRNSASDPIAGYLISHGVPHEVSRFNPTEVVFEFPIQAPESSRVVEDFPALAQLNHWKFFALHWCEHKPSISIYVREEEWMAVGAWVWENFEMMSGVSFFPLDDHVYHQAPYERLTEEEYTERAEAMPEELDFQFVEGEDLTTSSQELACQGGACEL